MKKLFFGNKPVVSAALAGLFLITHLVGTLFPGVSDALVIYPTNLTQPANWYRFVTYALAAAGGLGYWLYNALLLVFLGNIIEHRMQRKHLTMLILLSVFAAGLCYPIFYHDPYAHLSGMEAPLAGFGFISWGYLTVALVHAFRNRHALSIQARVLILLVGAFCIVNAVNVNQRGLLVAQLATIVVSLVFVTRPGVLLSPASREPAP
jgi:membrane associated rhomboid family serine protease